MKKKLSNESQKKLTLTKETLRKLSTKDLELIKGAGGPGPKATNLTC